MKFSFTPDPKGMLSFNDFPLGDWSEAELDGVHLRVKVVE